MAGVFYYWEPFIAFIYTNNIMKYSIFVSTCKKYSDCWEPMSQLLKKYWPGIENIPVYLATDKTDEAFDANASVFTNILTYDTMCWSELTRETLKQIDTDYVIFMLDDMWPKATVDKDRLESVMNVLAEDSEEGIGVIYFEKTNSKYPIYEANNDFYIQPFGTAYRISTGVAIWRTDYLLSLLNNNETAWDFERIGSFREEVEKYKALRVKEPLFDRCFIQGSVIRGKWDINIDEFCKQHGISIDKTRRSVRTKNDEIKQAIKDFIFNINPEMIVKIQNMIGYKK